MDTLFLSQGKIPVKFLRGAGVPEILIEYLGALTGKALEFYSCFISYSSANDDFARRLHADLQDKGVRCWFAPEDMKIGARPRPTIDDTIRSRDKLLLILSQQSVESHWVGHEVNEALNEEERRGQDVLFPIRIDDAVMDVEFGWAKAIRDAHQPTGRYIGDFTRWKEHDAYRVAFERLIRDLCAKREPL